MMLSYAHFRTTKKICFYARSPGGALINIEHLLAMVWLPLYTVSQLLLLYFAAVCFCFAVRMLRIQGPIIRPLNAVYGESLIAFLLVNFKLDVYAGHDFPPSLSSPQPPRHFSISPEREYVIVNKSLCVFFFFFCSYAF